MNPDAEPVASTPPSSHSPHIATTPESTSTPTPGTASRRDKTAAGIGRTFSSLKNRNFALLWLGMLFSMGGINMQMVARGYLVYDITGSAKILGLVSAGGALPVLVLSLFGGALADRVKRKRVVQVGQATSMALAFLIGTTIAAERIAWPHLFVAGMLQGTMWAFMMPARQAFVAQLVGKENIGNAVALSAVGMSVTTLVAPAVAGVLYSVIGPEGVYFVIAAMGLLAVLLTSAITDSGESGERSRSAVLEDIRDGLAYILRERLLLVLLAMSMAFVLLAMPVHFLMPVFVVDVYHRESEALGLLLSMLGLGSLVGSLVIASLGHWKRGAIVVGGGFATGVALMLMAAVPVYLAAAGIMVVLGLGSAANRAVNQALVMEHVTDRYRGRVMSLYMMSFGLMPLGVLPMGLAADVVGPRAVIAAMAVAMTAVTAVVLVTQKRLRAIQ